LVSPFWERLGRGVMAHPWLALTGAGLFLLLLATPALSLRFWNPSVDTLPPGSATRVAYDRLIRHTFPGVGGALWVLVEDPRHDLGSPGRRAALAAFAARLARVHDVYAVSPSPLALADPVAVPDFLSADGHDALFTVFPDSRAESQATQQLVRRLRSRLEAPPQARVMVGGGVAYTVDVIHLIRWWLPRIAFLIGGLTAVILYILFRSAALPVKAVLMNLASVSASLGLLVGLFQDGWLAPVLGWKGTGAIDWTTPIILFAVLFGLSTDYEVFLLSQVMAHHRSGLQDEEAVVRGLAETGRIITGAALIMVTVFWAFGAIGLEFMRELGFGLGLAILLDASVVRLVLVPAIMRLLGRWNWWDPLNPRRA
ncbi:MAG: MMPL family transporter, partial [Firmicutes bacterium]|nr:MMPL family transporter [Bacillota bacterium]